jgi:GntR family transcriptional repressor for pyruvate dehydrogenase complex
MTISLEPIERMTVSEEIIKKLIDLINSGVLRPGDKLPSERELMEQLHVSRASIREALRSLSLAGLLETHPGNGTYVSECFSSFIADQVEWSALLGEQDFLELVEVRESLEIQAAGLAAQRATLPQLGKLRQAIEGLRSSMEEDIEQEVDADLAFHTIIAEMAQNRVLYRLALSLRKLLREYIKRAASATETKMSTVEEHQAILEAIEERDEAKARQAMVCHLQISQQLALGGQAKRGNGDIL